MNKNKNLIKELARTRIERLYSLSLKAFPKNLQLAKSYVRLLVRIGSHYKVALPDEIKRGICRGCLSPLVVGVNVQIRVSGSHGYVINRCMGCGCEAHRMLQKGQNKR